MKIQEITNYLESIAPIALQESYDNCGLLVGDKNTIVTKALITLDCTESIIDEAIEIGSNFIIAHHPVIFQGIKKLNGSNHIERTIIKAIKNNIAIYAIHTNLDNILNGVNANIAKRLGVQNCKILSPKNDLLRHLVVYCPVSDSDKLRNELFKAGAGNIGGYSECSFTSVGKGTFRPDRGCDPHLEKLVKGIPKRKKKLR